MFDSFHSNGSKRLGVTIFFVSFIVFFVMEFSIAYFIESKAQESEVNALIDHESGIVFLGSKFLSQEIDMTISDLNLLKEHLLNTIEKGLTSGNYDAITKEWLIFSNNKKIYDQIRFIDYNGDEIIRVNFAMDGAYIVPASDLQNKKDRYYYIETAKLKEGQTYISKLDLNVENGKIEEPIKPMIRISAPVFSEDQEFLGIVILNYLAENLLEDFNVMKGSSQGSLYLLNEQGYWISGDNPLEEWGFMYEDRKEMRFGNLYPQEWEEILKGDSPVISSNGFFVSEIVIGEGNWRVVSYVNMESKYQAFSEGHLIDLIPVIVREYWIYFFLALLVSVMLGFLSYLRKVSDSRTKFFSEIDAQTGVLNRRAGLAKLKSISLNNRRNQRTISLCYIDIDGLKKVNDQFGHTAGDALIDTVTKTIKELIRETDFIIRLGGDEFLIVFRDTGVDNAEATWDRIQNKFQEINNSGELPYPIRVSHGIVEVGGKEKSYEWEEIIKQADDKMYQEKRNTGDFH